MSPYGYVLPTWAYARCVRSASNYCRQHITIKANQRRGEDRGDSDLQDGILAVLATVRVSTGRFPSRFRRESEATRPFCPCRSDYVRQHASTGPGLAVP